MSAAACSLSSTAASLTFWDACPLLRLLLHGAKCCLLLQLQLCSKRSNVPHSYRSSCAVQRQLVPGLLAHARTAGMQLGGPGVRSHAAGHLPSTLQLC